MGIERIQTPPPQPQPQPPHMYSQQLQLKLYQAFIFSIPILFSIILLLLFYLFYLKKRASSSSSSSHSSSSSSRSRPPIIRPSSNEAVFIDSLNGICLKEIVKLKLPVILYDENSRDQQTICCVCLGEFMVKEEIHKLPTCNHIFHIDCILLWLHSNSTCPLCRCSVLPTKNNPPNANGGQDQLLHSNYILYTDHINPPSLDLDGGLPILQAESIVITIQRAES